MSTRATSFGLSILFVVLGAVAVAVQVKHRSDAAPAEPQKVPAFQSIEKSFPRFCSAPSTNCEAILKNGQTAKIKLVKDTTKGTLWALVGNRPIRLQEFYDTVYHGSRPDSVMEIKFDPNSQ